MENQDNMQTEMLAIVQNNTYSKRAIQVIQTELNCCQSVLSAFAEEYGLGKELAFKMGTAFGAGIAQQGKICGAVVGAYMAIGLEFGRTNGNDTFSKYNTYEKIDLYNQKFTAKFGSTNCSEITGVNVNDDEEYAKAHSAGVFRNKCPLIVAYSAQLVSEIIKK